MASPLRLVPLSLVAVLAACKTAPAPEPDAPEPVVVVEDEPAWRQAAADEDVDRIERLPMAWTEALNEARRAGFTRAVAVEEALLRPGAALARPAPAPGSYQCRVLKLGGKGRARAFQRFNSQFCYIGVDGEQLTLTKQTGSDLPGGFLLDDKGPRMIFLGANQAAGEDAPPAYGEKPERNVAGVIERIGPLRFRLLIPFPREEAKLIVMEMTPSPVQPED
ncbi:MAG TPA: DUF4893 domain-containing protein [Allosphingosinicella sp.]|uniref:DUF4893 domain-containing protein n=1 Tax=Allosphingosinicella sp. TaxID=2823234 RepID=UPI002EDB9E36